MSKYGTKDKAR